MLDLITKKITNQIVLNFPNITTEKAMEIDYGLYMAFSDILKALTIIIVSLPFGLFLEVLTAIFTFGLLRMFLGGIHSKTQLGCLSAYFFIIYGNCILSILVTYDFLNVVLLPVSIVIAFLYSPADLPSKPILSKKQYKKLKLFGMIELIILFTISFFVPKVYSNIICINSFVVTILITPAAYKLTKNTLSNCLL
ncbi:accessory gene regulator B family protein [Ruminiclostridium herbifermentans]|uniref:Accessory gene regulator B family protein n=1 Tax=Ruminiclostridium herbifermentans TaxID=2488810 RepID=A0A4U7JGW7_9FIRM|nr:accessory gene regulator B family protein [Ruminiclostridium herbifermentans]QNU67232.1 accessory gene regulator B family protein [Ruminiclostridium herbifermentans]